MRKLSLAAAAVALLVNTGCTAIRTEVRYPGGYPGYLLDKRTFDASGSKQLVLLRATLILAMAADMGQVTVNGQDADGFAKLLASANDEINYAAADLYNGSVGSLCTATNLSDARTDANIALTDATCAGFRENFESDLPRVEGRIVKLMLAALPTDKARAFLDDIAKGNVMGAAWNALRVVANGAGGLHYAFGRYRSGLEVVAGSSNCAAKYSGPPFDATTMTVVHAAQCLGLSETDLFVNPNDATRDDLAGAKVNQRAFFMLMRSVAADCVNLPYSGSSDELGKSQTARASACNGIGFDPRPRPYRIVNGTPSTRIAEATTHYADTPSPALSPTPSPSPTSTPVP